MVQHIVIIDFKTVNHVIINRIETRTYSSCTDLVTTLFYIQLNTLYFI